MPCALFGTDGANKKTATAKSPLFEPFCGTAAFAAFIKCVECKNDGRGDRKGKKRTVKSNM